VTYGRDKIALSGFSAGHTKS